MKIIAGNSNIPLVQEIAEYLDIRITEASLKRFADMEVFTEIHENVRGQDVYLVQSTNFPANDNLMEMLVAIDALRRGSASRITAVIPYYGYARQDRKTAPRTPISAKLVAKLLETAGVHRVLTIDLHANQIQGFFEVPTDNLFAMPVLNTDLSRLIESGKVSGENLAIVSPDVGGVLRARAKAKNFSADLAIIDKRREKAGVSEVMHIIGDVNGKDCIIVDDICDSAGTLCNAAKALMEQGAKSVRAYITHGVFSGPAMTRIAESCMEEVIVTNTIEATETVKANPKVRQVTIAPLLGEAILRISQNRSVSALFPK